MNNSVKTNFYRAGEFLGMAVAEDFASTAFPPALFGLGNPDGGITWTRSGSAGGWGLSATSAKYDFFSNSLVGDMDDLYLPPLNLDGSAVPLLTFDVAHAQYGTTSPTSNDMLEVLVSDDCGANWSVAYSAAGAALATRPQMSSAFTPNGAQWRTESVYFPNLNLGTLLVKFRATSDYGNNLYLDNINLRQEDPVGVKNINSNVVGVNLYPNPSNGETTLKINALVSSNSKVMVVNTLGQVVYTSDVALAAGANTVKMDASKFAAGVYSVIIDSNNTKTVKKLTVN
jgi:hypothetical protein